MKHQVTIIPIGVLAVAAGAYFARDVIAPRPTAVAGVKGDSKADAAAAGKTDAKSAGKGGPGAPTPVEVVALKSGVVKEELLAVGSLRSNESVILRPEVSGRIAAIGLRMLEKSVPLQMLMADLAAEPPVRVPGTAVFMFGNPEGTPPALVHNLAHNKVLHEKIVFLTVITEEVPHVPGGERVTLKRLGKGFASVVARYGFMEDPDINEILDACREHKLDINVDAATFFLGRETLIASDRPGMAMWREHLFAFMSRNALRATAFFRIPANQVFEVGAQVEL